MMGSSIHVHVRNDEKESILIIPTLDIKYKGMLDMGNEISFSFFSNAIHVFDEEGNNLESK